MAPKERRPTSSAANTLLVLCDQLQKTPSPEIAWLTSLGGEPKREEQIRLLLYRAALDHGLGSSALDQLMSLLWDRWEKRLWELPALREKELEASLNSLQWFDRWMLREQATGIVWSVGKFIRKHQPLEQWVRAPLTHLLDEAANEIFWFGAHSAERLKGRRFLSSLHLSSPWGMGIAREATEWNSWRFPVWRGSIRFWLRYRSEITAEERSFTRIEVAEQLSRFFCEIDHSDPLKLSYAARFFDEIVK